MRIDKPMWIALSNRGRIQATWYRGCAQPFAKWRKAVISLGWKPLCAYITYSNF